jgi:hypothetical protein
MWILAYVGMSMLELDHLVVAGPYLDEATSHAEASLGSILRPGGQHERFGTHNRVIGLGDGLYLEAIAIDPAAEPPSVPRWFGLDDFTGGSRLHAWACRVEDLDAALQQFPEAGTPVQMQRGHLRWRFAVPDNGHLPYDGVFPALIEWQGCHSPGFTLASDALALKGLTVTHPNADELKHRLAPVLSGPVHFETGPVARLEAEITNSGALRCLM